jgi:hypothetical protein
MFSAPSSQPPFGTESRCPPMISVLAEAPGSVHHWLRASSNSISIPSSLPASQS